MISTTDCHLGTISKPRGGCRGSSVALAWLGKAGSLVRIAASGDNSGSWIYGVYHQSYQVVAGSFESSQGIAVARLSVWEHGESNNIYIGIYIYVCVCYSLDINIIFISLSISMYIHITLIVKIYIFFFGLPPPWSPISIVMQTRTRSRSSSGDDLASGSLVSKAQLIGAAPYPGAGELKRWIFWADTAWEFKCQLAHLFAVQYTLYNVIIFKKHSHGRESWEAKDQSPGPHK